MELQKLTKKLDALEAKNAKQLLASLDERKKAEVEFHNWDRSREHDKEQEFQSAATGNKKFYNTCEVSRQWIDKWLADNVPGKIVLDLACGNGGTSLKAAELGAQLVIGIDLSDVSIDNCKERAARAGQTGNTRFLQADGEATGLPDDSVDVILCMGVLHHMDLSFVYPELRRILKPGGKILAVEALGYNPAIQMYRKFTSSMRTEWEADHILKLAEVQFAKRFFELETIKYWHITSMAAAFFPEKSFVRKSVQALTNRVDSLLTRIPAIQYWSWQFTFVLKSRKPISQ